MAGIAPILVAEGLSRKFGKVTAIDAVNLRVQPGEVFGLVGPDGAGKTTLLQLFAAILDPSAGRCTVLGFDTNRESAAITARIGYMPQGFTLYERLTIGENLTFAAKVRNVSRADYRTRVGPLLSMAGLVPFVDRREGHLSGGMRKKLALCTNLIHEPPLLLLDEPGLGVDPLSRRELWRMLEQYRRRGATVIFSTSYMDEAERCDRVGILDQGQLIAIGSSAELSQMVANSVFGITTHQLEAASSRLRAWSNVISVVWRANEVRFVADPRVALTPDQLTELKEFGSVEPKKPSIEDAYVALRGRTEATESDEAPIVVPGTASTPAQSVAIKTADLTRLFGNFVAVERVSLEVKLGEIFGLLGANGAGKTTLIRMLCGLLPVSSGSAHVAGIDVARSPGLLRQRIGYMSQRFSLYPDLTIRENLQFFASAYGIKSPRARNAIEWAGRAAGLDLDHTDLVCRLSSAVRQRLALACSVLHGPSVLFLDEPTSGVDPLSRFRFWRLVSRMAAYGSTVIVTTHYLDEAAYCHRLGFMHEGRLIAVGDLATLRTAIGVEPQSSNEDVFIAYIERHNRAAIANRGAAS